MPPYILIILELLLVCVYILLVLNRKTILSIRVEDTVYTITIRRNDVHIIDIASVQPSDAERIEASKHHHRYAEMYCIIEAHHEWKKSTEVHNVHQR
jgi:hypothetical protein